MPLTPWFKEMIRDEAERNAMTFNPTHEFRGSPLQFETSNHYRNNSAYRDSEGYRYILPDDKVTKILPKPGEVWKFPMDPFHPLRFVNDKGHLVDHHNKVQWISGEYLDNSYSKVLNADGSPA